MKIIEVMNGIQMPITNEESDVLGKFESKETVIEKQDLTEREQLLANQLVVKGALVRRNQDGKIQYRRPLSS